MSTPPRTPQAPPSSVPQGVPASPLNPHTGQALLQELQSEVSTEAAPLLQFIVKHVKTIVTFFVLFIILLAGVGGYNWYTADALQKAQDELSRLVFTKDGAERVTALENFLPTAPQKLQGAALLIAAESAIQAKDYTAAAAFFTTLAQAEPNTATGLFAAFNQGQALLLANKATEALAVLNALQSTMPEQSRPLVDEAIVEAALLAQDTEKARTTLESLAAMSNGSTAEFFLYRARQLPPSATDTP